MKTITVFLLLCLAVSLTATITTPGYVPNTDTAIATSTVQLSRLHLNNKSGSSSDCVIKDRGTACGGGVCSLWGPATLGASGSASSVVTWNFEGAIATNGFTWSCTTSSAVVGYVSYGPPLN